ncbi:MAG: hypothetical protein RLZZ15_3373 [Verrucomicrobiota bacterium]
MAAMGKSGAEDERGVTQGRANVGGFEGGMRGQYFGLRGPGPEGTQYFRNRDAGVAHGGPAIANLGVAGDATEQRVFAFHAASVGA